MGHSLRLTPPPSPRLERTAASSVSSPAIEADLHAGDAEPSRGWPRLLSRKLAAAYLSVSVAEIDRLIHTGAIAVVRLPAVRHQNGTATTGTNRRVLIDRVELDALCTRNREYLGR